MVPPPQQAFTVQSLASAHGLVNQNATWTSTTASYGASSIQVSDKNDVSKGTPAARVKAGKTAGVKG